MIRFRSGGWDYARRTSGQGAADRWRWLKLIQLAAVEAHGSMVDCRTPPSSE
jgi:hypothetical protein